MCKEDTGWIERIEDICGGYFIAHKNGVSKLVLAGESPSDALRRIDSDLIANKNNEIYLLGVSIDEA